MHDVGKVENYMGIEQLSSKPKKKVKYYPSLYLSSKQFPELLGKEVGDECKLILKSKVKSHSLDENMNGDKREDFTLEIQKMGKLDNENY